MDYTSCQIFHDSLELCRCVTEDPTLVRCRVQFGSPHGSKPVRLACCWPANNDTAVKVRLSELLEGGWVKTSVSRNVANKRHLELDDCLDHQTVTSTHTVNLNQQRPGVWSTTIDWPGVRFLKGVRVEGTAVSWISLENGHLSWARSIIEGTSIYDRDRPGNTIWPLSLATLQSTRVTVHCALGCEPVLHVCQLLVSPTLERSLTGHRVYCTSFSSEDAELDARVACWDFGQASSLYIGPFDRDVREDAKEKMRQRNVWVDANPVTRRVEWESLVKPPASCPWMPSFPSLYLNQ